MSDKEYDEEERESDDGRGAGIAVLSLLLIFILPSLVLAYIYYGLLRFGRMRKSVILSVTLIVDFFALLYALFSNPIEKLMNVIKNVTSIADNWTDAIPILVVINIILGGILGYLAVLLELKQMQNNPHRLKVKGNWMYQFKFRRTPLEIRRRAKIIDRLKNGSYESPERAPLGLDENEEYKPAFRYSREARRHTYIIGASGSGKTITMQSLIKNDIDCGIPVFIVDMKRSPEFASKVAKWCYDNDIEFLHFVNGSPDEYDIPYSPGQCFYDPLGSGTPTSKADMVLGMREWNADSAVYKSAMQQLLQVLFAAFRDADRKLAPNIDWNHGGIYMLASALQGNNLADLTAACEGTESQKQIEEVNDLWNEARKSGRSTQGIPNAIKELQGQMRTIVSSEYGKWLRTTTKGKSSIDTFKASKGNGTVVMFSLNSDSEPEFAKYVGSMILSDLTATSAKRRNKQIKNPVNIYIDEFQTLNPGSVTGLLEKSRESAMGMTLAQQSFEQVIASSERNGEAYLGSILDTCSNFIVHAGSTERSATRLSEIIGKEDVDWYTVSNKNKASTFSFNFFNKRNQVVKTDRVKEWKFAPDKFQELSMPDEGNNYRTTAVMVNKSSSDPDFSNRTGAVARELLMIPSNEVLEEYYNGATYTEPEDDYGVDLEKDEYIDEENIDDTTNTGSHSVDEEFETVNNYEDDYEDEDFGSFSFEKVDDDEGYEEEVNYSNEPLPIFDSIDVENFSTAVDEEDDMFDDEDDTPSPKSTWTKSSLKETSFNSLFNDDVVSPPAKTVKPKTKPKTVKKVIEEDDDSLPDIDF